MTRKLLAGLFGILALASSACGRDQVVGLGSLDASVDLTDGAVSNPDGGGPIDGFVFDSGAPDGGVLVTIEIRPADAMVSVGRSIQLTAIGRFFDGTTADITAMVGWGSSNTLIVSSLTAGVFRGLSPGNVLISADLFGVRGRTTLTVGAPATLVAITLSPPIATLVIGSRQTFAATGQFSDGSSADVSAMAVWSTDNPMVAAAMGQQVFAIAPGDATLTAAIGPISGSAKVIVPSATLVSLVVTPARATQVAGTFLQYTADGTLSDGTHQDLTQSASWLAIDPMVASIDAGGLAKLIAAGATTITATFGGISGSAQLTVVQSQLVQIQIQPVDPTVGVGVTIPFSAIGIYADGSSADITTQVAWSSSAPMVAAIDPSGRASSTAPGTTIITASLDGVMAESTVTVTPAMLVRIIVTPASSTLSVAGTVPLIATGAYADGTTADLTRSVTWSSGDPMIASVSSAGLVTALAPGSTQIVAMLGMISGAAMITVSDATLRSIAVTPATARLPAGTQLQLRATGTFSDGTMRDITTQVSWSSSAPGIATVTNGTGSVQGLSAGMATITASLMGVRGTALITVTGVVLTSITIAPANATTTAGLRSDYTATGHYADGSTLDLTTQVTWTTGDPAVATISNVAGAKGQLLAIGPGTTRVTATMNGISGSTTVTVGGSMIVQITVAPIAITTPTGRTIQYSARAIMSDGSSQNITRMAQWASSNPMVASISPNGTVNALAGGTTTIRATYMGLSGSTPLTVDMAVPVSIQVNPIAPRVIVGTALTFSAVLVYSDGSTQPVGGPMAGWTSSDPMVFQVSSGRGGVRGVAIAPGMATVSVSFMGLTGSTVVTVTSAQVVRIELSPAVLSVPVGTRRQLQAVAIFSDGTSQTITNQATWLSSDPNVAQVTTGMGGRGTLVALAPGMATITASYMGLSGTAAITVTAATLSTIQVTPFDRTIPVGFRQPYQAVAIFSDATTLDVTGLATWQSTNPGVAAVTTGGGPRGVVTTLAAGMTSISATYMSVTGSTPLTVVAATLQTISVLPSTATVAPGGIQPFTATGHFSGGLSFNLTTSATWSSSDTAIADVSNAPGSQGEATGFRTGMVTIRAQRSGITGQATLSVR